MKDELYGWWNAPVTDGKIFRGGVHPVDGTDPVRLAVFVNVSDGTINLGDYATGEEASAALDDGLRRYPRDSSVGDALIRMRDL